MFGCVQLEELKFEYDELKHTPQQATAEQVQKVKDLQKVIDSLKAELKRKVQDESKPNEDVNALNKEIERLKVGIQESSNIQEITCSAADVDIVSCSPDINYEVR